MYRVKNLGVVTNFCPLECNALVSSKEEEMTQTLPPP